MYDSLRENLSYFGLYKRMFKAKKEIMPKKISFGNEKQWFKTLDKGIITNRSLEKGKYRGYWCIESAALVKALELDGTELKECKYYPYDMTHFCE